MASAGGGRLNRPGNRLSARLDTVREVYTPEGVSLRLPVAGPVPRAVAWGIDFGIRFAIYFVGAVTFGLLGNTGMGLQLILVFSLLWGYPVLFEVLWNGQTPGKRALGLRVIAADGAPVGWVASFARTLLRTVDFLPFFYGIGLVTCYADPWNRRVGDLVARTLVIHELRRSAHRPAEHPGIFAPLAPLQAQEQAAVIAFADRARALTPERQEELADIAAPAVGAGGALGVRRLHGVANRLLGRE